MRDTVGFWGCPMSPFPTPLPQTPGPRASTWPGVTYVSEVQSLVVPGYQKQAQCCLLALWLIQAAALHIVSRGPLRSPRRLVLLSFIFKMTELKLKEVMCPCLVHLGPE